MAGQNLTLCLWNDGELAFSPAIDLVKLADIALAGGLQRQLIFRVGFHQAVEDILRVQRTVRGAVPRMRIGYRCAIFFKRVGFDSAGSHHQLAFEPGCFNQPVQPALQPQAVDHHHIGVVQQRAVFRRGLEGMRIAVWPH